MGTNTLLGLDPARIAQVPGLLEDARERDGAGAAAPGRARGRSGSSTSSRERWAMSPSGDQRFTTTVRWPSACVAAGPWPTSVTVHRARQRTLIVRAPASVATSRSATLITADEIGTGNREDAVLSPPPAGPSSRAR
jgi:hypothetical protein